MALTLWVRGALRSVLLNSTVRRLFDTRRAEKPMRELVTGDSDQFHTQGVIAGGRSPRPLEADHVGQPEHYLNDSRGCIFEDDSN